MQKWSSAKMSDDELYRLAVSLSAAIRIAYGGESTTQCPHCEIERKIPILKLTDIIICRCDQCGGYMFPFGGELLPLPTALVESEDLHSIKFEMSQVITKTLHKLVRRLLWTDFGDDNISASDLPDTLEDLLEE